METTRHPAAASSLASIMFAPQGQLSFGDSLERFESLEYKYDLGIHNRLKHSYFSRN